MCWPQATSQAQLLFLALLELAMEEDPRPLRTEDPSNGQDLPIAAIHTEIKHQISAI